MKGVLCSVCAYWFETSNGCEARDMLTQEVHPTVTEQQRRAVLYAAQYDTDIALTDNVGFRLPLHAVAYRNGDSLCPLHLGRKDAV